MQDGDEVIKPLRQRKMKMEKKRNEKRMKTWLFISFCFFCHWFSFDHIICMSDIAHIRLHTTFPCKAIEASFKYFMHI